MKNNLIGISGKMGSGKDTVGSILQDLSATPRRREELERQKKDVNYLITTPPTYQIKKFADKLKDIACLLIGCTREDLESQEFKSKELGEEWWKYEQYDKNDEVWGSTSKDFYTRLKHVKSAKFRIVKMTPRLLLQLLGTDCGRDIIHPNIWVNSLFADYKPQDSLKGVLFTLRDGSTKFVESALSYPSWIITDCRFPNEAEAVKSRGGIVIRVERPLEIKVQHSGREDDFTIEKFDPTNEKHVTFKKGYELNQHASETGLDDYQGFDHVVINDGTIEELVEKIRNLNLV